MLKVGDTMELSASDLVGHLNCRHLTNLDLAVAEGRLAKPSVWNPVADILRERGARHEKDFIDHLIDGGYQVTVINGGDGTNSAAAQTINAMRSGAEIVVQGVLQCDGWRGRADVLRKIGTLSSLGPWSYEVLDTKLAQETKGGTVLQLCLYSDLVGAVQGLRPERTYVVTPWTNYKPETFRTADYGAYYRHVRASLDRAVADEPPTEFYPEPVDHCDVCRWREKCEQQRRADDHLSLVAGITKTQIAELQRRQIGTVASLATTPIPLPWKPDRGAAQSYERIREQARIQVQGRAVGHVIYESLPVAKGFGLCCLSPPSDGDIFFDLEGDPFVGESGLEYLFGYSFRNEDGTIGHVAQWALSRAQEKAAFETFVDFVMERLGPYPDLHIYHYAPYEPGALKRLMGRYASRENELDRMLRSKVFVDLYGVVRHSLRASVESYSIKKLEPLYGFQRETLLPDANLSLFRVQTRLELNDLQSLSEDDRAVVQGYNRDDCTSTWRLRDWLEGLRSKLISQGSVVNRPDPETGDPSENLSAWQQKIAALAMRLASDVPPDVKERTPEQHARWLLANLLDWHRREEKSVWWDYFRLAELGAEELVDEPAGLSGLEFLGVTGGTDKSPIHRYSFPPQDTDLRSEEDLRALGGSKIGSLQKISLEERCIDIKKRRDSVETHPEAVFGHNVVPSEVLRQSLLRVGEYVPSTASPGRGSIR
jgi:uncharacterized protein